MEKGITSEDIKITGTCPFYTHTSDGQDVCTSIDVEFLLFDTIVCQITTYNEHKDLGSISNEIVNYINNKLWKRNIN